MSVEPNSESNTATPDKCVQGDHVENPSVEDLFAEDLAYGPDGMRGLLGNSYVFGAAFLASLGGFSFGYDQGVISIINVMDQFKEAFPQTKTAFGTSFMTAMLLLGAFVGCIFMPYLADKISRKWALTVVVVIFDIGAIIQTSAQSYGMLVAGRAIGGIGVGTLAMVCKNLPFKASLLDFYCFVTAG
jgi:MFS family permease